MKHVPVIILGAGGVGQALLRQIVDGRDRVANRVGCQFDVVAAADSSSWVWQPQGIGDDVLRRIIAAKESGLKAGSVLESPAPRPSDVQIVDQAHAYGLESFIVVDVTAISGMEPVLNRTLQLGGSVAMANKKALAGSWDSSRGYFNHPRLRHESTVGGGQPVISTLRYLLDTNDPIFQIQGQLSGTLGFICGRLDEGTPFSEAVTEAKAKGFTEPDPREDLGGQDVMRKVMILGRMAGWPLNAGDIKVESLYPSELSAMPVPEFMQNVSTLDEKMRQRVARAAADGNVLRYMAELTEEGGTVGLKPLPASSPLANLKYISFRTARYNDEPLLIGGKGAGVEMTAAGVLGDMIDLVRQSGS